MSKRIGSIFPMIFCLLIGAVFVLILCIPQTRSVFKEVTAMHPFLMGFVKFSLLATVGEIFAARLEKKCWQFPRGVVAKFVVWGFFGIVIALMFKVYSGGVAFIIQSGIIDGKVGGIWSAFLTSLIMNATFGMALMISHKVTDTMINLKCEKRQISVENVISSIDFKTLMGFTIMKTIPLFWIPVHTICFMLPGEYQIMFAAFLSIVLGVILSLKKGY